MKKEGMNKTERKDTRKGKKRYDEVKRWHVSVRKKGGKRKRERERYQEYRNWRRDINRGKIE